MRITIIIYVLLIGLVHAKGPANIATIEKNFLPFEIKSRTDFDKASRLEILLFLKTFKIEVVNPLIESLVGIKKSRYNKSSVNKWEETTEKRLMNLYLSAMKSCLNKTALGCDFSLSKHDSLNSFGNKLLISLDASFDKWKNESTKFYSVYSREQIRLASLFPKPTSEIFKLSQNEINGEEFKDGEFLFTMDDGPDVLKTEIYVKLLSLYGINSIFFVLGEKLNDYINKNGIDDTRKLYGRHCLASHGRIHKSHQSLKSYEDSIVYTDNLIKKVSGKDRVHFRPPYGQRNDRVLKKLESLKSTNILWNIDSNDWHSKISSDQIVGRITKLMTLWRKGIILFHDVHDKAICSIPHLSKFVKNSNLTWKECSSIGQPD